MTLVPAQEANAVIYIDFLPSKFVAVSLNDPNPAVLGLRAVFLSSAPVSLSSRR